MNALNIGCGSRIIPGFTNLDIMESPGVDVVADAASLPFSDSTFDLVYASHILEHFNRNDVLPVLTEWIRVLKPGGVIRLSVPSFEAAIEWYSRTGEIGDIIFVFSGGQDHGFDFHRMVFDRKSLGSLMEMAGAIDIKEWNWRETEHADVDDFSQAYLPHLDKKSGLHMSLNLEGRKQ